MSLPDIQQPMIKIISPIEVSLVLEEFKKLENDIKVYERRIESHRKAISDYAAKCIALQTPPNLTKFD